METNKYVFLCRKQMINSKKLSSIKYQFEEISDPYRVQTTSYRLYPYRVQTSKDIINYTFTYILLPENRANIYTQ